MNGWWQRHWNHKATCSGCGRAVRIGFVHSRPAPYRPEWSRVAIYNLFDSMPGEPIQLRDEYNVTLWEGIPVDGEVLADIPRPASVRWITKTDGTPIYDFGNEALYMRPPELFRFRPDYRLGN